MKITLFVPCLNEVDGIKSIMPKINNALFEQILIVDGQSKDNTVDEAKKMGYEVYIQKNKGIRHAYIEAWPLIRGNYVITFSPDGNCIPDDINLIVKKLEEGYDMVIASRYFGNAKSEDDDIKTKFGNWLFSSLISLFYGHKYKDAMTIFRGYKTSMFYEMDLDKEQTYSVENIFNTVIGIEPILSIRAAKCKYKISEIPSDEPKRIFGERKLQIFRWGGSYMLQVFRELFYWKKKAV
jgi:glycosyltransferase involved in cell wall biosynthesis